MYIYQFGEGPDSKKLRGGKGNNLHKLTKLGLPIPPGFTITSDTCIEYLNNDYQMPDGLWEEVKENLKILEEKAGKMFGDPNNPLLISVRSGAKFSMPGMMDTILDLGLNKETVEIFGREIENVHFVKDSYRRLIQMMSDVAYGLDKDHFEDALEMEKNEADVEFDYELDEAHLDHLTEDYLKLFKRLRGEEFPQDPMVQLKESIEAVFKSWNNRRAINYRNHEGIPHDLGTAVNIQTMVFGNYDDNSGTGVLFTRDPATGEKKLYGEFLVNAQGEDVVAGVRTPMQISALKDTFPSQYKELQEFSDLLEKELKDMQDIEFTIEQGKLYILQTRDGKRTGVAAAKIAVDMVNEGLLDKKTAIMRLTPRDVEESLFPSVVWENPRKNTYYDIKNIEEKLENKSLDEIKDEAEVKTAEIVGEGLPAGPGAACGHVIFSSDLAEKIVNGETEPSWRVTRTKKVNDRTVPRLILVKKETSPEDFHGMVASDGIITMRGGMTSHAALVGRQIGKRVIVGASTSGLELRSNVFGNDKQTFKEGDVISMEVFEEGKIYDRELPIVTPTELPDELETILDWADAIAKIKVRTNADKQNDTQMAIDFKAVGTGLARTEHQFFDALDIMRDMIMSDSETERKKHLDKMVTFQIKDFVDLFRTAEGRPVTIRLLDPPLHEFLPNELELREKIWKEHLHPGSYESNVLRKVLFFQEANPMLGLRGCRLGLMYPEISKMQAEAIFKAALQVKKEGIDVDPEIMVPLVGFRNEFTRARNIIDKAAEEAFKEADMRLDYKVGTMIEIPRAALLADEIAAGEDGADFFSFGTNDLHQMTLGFSRDDVAKFLPFYLEEGIIDADPFQTIETDGVGKLMDICVREGREAAEKVGKYLKIGLCGEHGGEPSSIDFCYQIGLDYISASPYRVPVARLAAGQATLKFGDIDTKYLKKLDS